MKISVDLAQPVRAALQSPSPVDARVLDRLELSAVRPSTFGDKNR